MKLEGQILMVFFVICLLSGTTRSFESEPCPEYKNELKMGDNNNENGLIKNLLEQHPQFFSGILNNPEEYRIQIIYTQISRNEKGAPRFTDHMYRVDGGSYFYPASTVKLPVAALALQKINELNIRNLDKNTSMITGEGYEKQSPVYNDPHLPDGRPTIEGYIKKLLLVSDNDAYNRLYEFLGQEYINQSLHRMGYKDAQIIHRLEISLTEDQNRHTNPVKFLDSAGNVIYSKPPEKSKLIYDTRNDQLGKGYYSNGKLIHAPFDFSKKNRLGLQSLHSIVRSIMFPESVPQHQRFRLNEEDYLFLRKYMSMYPAESDIPAYKHPDYWDTYVKFLYYGSEKVKPVSGLKIYNKVGDAYGFLIDAAYLHDSDKNIEFLLSAVIHVNGDGIYNDNRYEYDSIGFPFMKHLGKLIYEYELRQKSSG